MLCFDLIQRRVTVALVASDRVEIGVVETQVDTGWVGLQDGRVGAARTRGL
jgi:hypothetical protein